ncbi:MAG TPA: acyl carrier protein [Pyrinomonadaceae bacterium]|jgi:fengycin family lipopeptide synthetase D
MNERRTYEVVRNKVAELCELPVEKVHGNSNFFDLGFHSLLAVQFVAEIERELNIRLSLVDVFVYPSVTGIVESIEKKQASEK